MARIRQKLDRAEWAKLSQDMQAAYIERNGEYVLDTEDAAELRAALERLKAENLSDRVKLAELGDVDAQEYQRLKKAEADAQREKDIEKGNWEKIRAEDEKNHRAELDKFTGREKTLRVQLEESLVDGEITRAIAAYPGAKVTPLLLGAKRVVKLQEMGGKLRAVVLDERGEPRLRPGAKTTDDYMTPNDLVTEMRNDREWAGNFPATNTTPADKRPTVSSPESRAQKEVIQRLSQAVADGATRVQ